ncbi:BZ3500_MvSof-1268-A1-R1_Chr9g10353 [Microbotryum saponariae]|uniref:BZ3500_MvSof-1268-A1-R1_Chr9g10353 protein n=1 Tax=Microbotryum saponariae TaxID=289078 RepID=A0A2X0LU88_9BASI|nr:BZ3501_MvSof-1269-A2-R1_Chr9g10103 [Microbotryum saponariae]SCZ99955.1 BZ3500_MvSof-1268-A1-R1_Chr9g10353 [Microbotryum saponariae]
MSNSRQPLAPELLPHTNEESCQPSDEVGNQSGLTQAVQEQRAASAQSSAHLTRSVTVASPPFRPALAPAPGSSHSKLSQVDPSLFISSYDGASSLPDLQQRGITHIVNVTSEYEDCFPSHFVYLRLRARDKSSERLGPYFDQVAEFVIKAQHARGRVLVHCQEGISRSATLVLAVMIINERQTLDQAFDALRIARPVIEPSPNFLRELRALERRLFGVASTRRLTPAEKGSTDDLEAPDNIAEELTRLTSMAAISETRPSTEDFRTAIALERGMDNTSALPKLISDAVYVTFDVYARREERDLRARAALARFFNAFVDAGIIDRADLRKILQNIFTSEAWEDFAMEDVPYAAGYARELLAQLT